MEDIVASFLGRLGNVDASTLMMYLDGLTAEEMSGVLGISANAVALRVNRLNCALASRWKWSDSNDSGICGRNGGLCMLVPMAIYFALSLPPRLYAVPIAVCALVYWLGCRTVSRRVEPLLSRLAFHTSVRSSVRPLPRDVKRARQISERHTRVVHRFVGQPGGPAPATAFGRLRWLPSLVSVATSRSRSSLR